MPDPKVNSVLSLANALSGQESGGDYSAINKRTGAIGRWQVLPSNIPIWSKEILGHSITPSKFRNSPELQNQIVLGKLGKEVDRNSRISQSPIEAQQRTALWWYSGSNDPSNTRFWNQRPRPDEPSGKEYVAQVTRRLTGLTPDTTKRPTITAPGSYQPSELPYPQPVNPTQVQANVDYLSSRPAAQDIPAPQPLPDAQAFVPPPPKQPFKAPRYAPPPSQGGTSNIQAPNIPTGASLSGLPAEPAPVIREGDYGGPTQLAPKPQPRQIQEPGITPPAISTGVDQPIARESMVSDRVRQAQEAIKSGAIEQGDVQPDAQRGVVDKPTRSLGELAYANEYAANNVAQSGMTEEAYIQHRTRQDAVAALSKAGTTGKILSAIVGPAPTDPGSDALKKFSLDAANSMSGGLIESVNPEAMAAANKALDLGTVGNLVIEHGAGLAGTIIGVKGAGAILKKAAGPLIAKLAAPIVEGLAGALYQAPSEAVQVAKGKPIGEALKSVAITGAQFGLIEPAAKAAEEIASVAAPLGGREAARWNTMANAALQSSIMAGGEYANTGTISPETVLTGLALSMSQVREANKRFKTGPEIDVATLNERYPIPKPKVRTVDELTSGIGQEFVNKVPEAFAEPKPPAYQSLIPKGESNAITTGEKPNSYSEQHPRVDENISPVGENRQLVPEEQRTRLADFTGDSGTGSGAAPEEIKPLSGRAQKRADKEFIANFNPSNVEDAALHFIAEGNKFNLPEIKRDVFGSNLKVGGRKGSADIPSSFLNVADNKGITVDRFITDYLPGKLGVEELSPKQQMDARNDIHNAIGKIASRGDAIELLKKRSGETANEFEQMKKAYAEPIPEPDIAQAEVLPEFEAAFYGGKQESMFSDKETRGKSLLEKDLDERIGLAEKAVKEAYKTYDQKKKEAASAILGGASEKYANEALRKYEDSAKAAENILIDLKSTRDERIAKIRGSEQSLFEQADYGGQEKKRIHEFFPDLRRYSREEVGDSLAEIRKTYEVISRNDENAIMDRYDELNNEITSLIESEKGNIPRGETKLSTRLDRENYPGSYNKQSAEAAYYDLREKYVDARTKYEGGDDFSNIKKTKAYKVLASYFGEDYILPILKQMHDIREFTDYTRSENKRALADKFLSDYNRYERSSVDRVVQSETESADYGGGATKPEETSASTAPDKTPEFADNTPVYTYAVDESGNISNPVPIKGRIVTKEVAVRDETGRWAKDADGNTIRVKRQFINPGNDKLVPVDEHTMAVGQPHPLTQSLRGENAPSTFVISRLGNDIAKSWGAEGANYILTGKGKAGSVKMGPEGATVNLHRNIFVDPNLASGVAVHEIGHIADYSGPELTMERGNIVGHIQALRRDMEPVLKGENLFGTYEFSPEEKAAYAKTLRKELTNLASQWHPFEKTSKSYIEARTTSRELMADAVGAMINDPELVRRVAPKFFDEYNDFIEARPETKAVFDNLSKALHGDEIALGKMAQDYLHNGYDQAEVFRQLSEDATDQKGRKLIQGDNWWNTYSASDKLAVRAIRVAERELKQAGLTQNDHAEYADIVKKEGIDAANAWLDRSTTSLRKGKTIERPAYTDAQKQAIKKAAALFGEGEAEWPKQLALNHSLRTTGDQQAAMVHYWENDIYQPLKDAGVTLNEFGDYLTATAVLGNYRAGLANPGALDAGAARAILATLRHDLKPEAYTLLESKVRQMRDQMVSLMEDAHLEGLISDETMATVHNNSDSYARFASAEKAARNVRLSRVQAKGTLNEIQNPALSLPLQMLDLRQKIAVQKATKNLVGLITEMGEQDETIEPFAQRPGGNNTIAYYDNGKRVEVSVDPYYSSMYHYAPEQFTGKVAQAVRFLLDKTRGLQSGLLIRFSLPFQFKNPLKDAAETYQNIGLGVFAHYPSAYKEARLAQKGKLTGAAREAYTHGVVREFNATGRASYEKPPNPQRALLEAAGARERIKSQPVSRLTDIAAKVFGSSFWESLEAVPKLAAREYYLEKGHTPEMADYLAATLAGTPDTRIRGKATRSVGSLFLFANVNAQGKLRTARLIKNPRTNSAYAVRTLVTMAPKILMYAAASKLAYTAAAEVFGEDNDAALALQELHDLYQYVGDYFLSNYLVIPYGSRINSSGNRVAQTVTLPISETDQLLSSFLQPIFNQASDNTRNFSDFVSEFGHSAGNIIPSLGPVEQTVLQWSDYLMRENPDDPFYGTNVLSDQQYAVDKNNLFASDPIKQMAENSLRNLFGGQYRMIQSFADINKPFEFMSFYRETRSGIDEKTRRLKIASEASKAAGQLERSIITKQGPDAIERAYDNGKVTDKQYKSMLRKAGNPTSIYRQMTDEELQSALDEMSYDPGVTAKINAEIDRRADN